jgi:pimeloyl-ACP methyl ester carboxylesterase
MRKKPLDRDHDLTSKRFLLKSILMASCLFLILAAMVLPQCTPQATSEDAVVNWVITEDEIQSVFGGGIYTRDPDNYRAQYWTQIINGWDVQIDNALAQGGIEPSSVRAEVLSAQWQLKNSVMLNVHVISFWQDPKADVIVQKLRSRMPVYKGISPSVPGTTLSLDQQPVDIGDYAFLSTEQVKGYSRPLYLIEFVKGYVFADVIGSGEHIASQLEQLASILASKIPPAPGTGATGLTVTSDVKGVVVDGVSSARIHVKLSTTENRRVTLTDDKTKPQMTNAVNGEAVFEYVPDLKALSLAYGDIPRGGYELTLTASDDQQQSASMNLKLYRKPIVLVHGIFSSPKMWDKMKDSLQNDGFEVFCVDYSSPQRNAADITSIAETEAASTIKQVMTDYANRKISLAKVDVLAHSMGGLVMRQYIVSSASKGDDIGTLIMIGTPHLGSPLPTLYLRHMNDPNFQDIIKAIGIHEGPALKQLNYTNNEFLTKLNAASLNSNVKYYNIIGENNLVGRRLNSIFLNDRDCHLLEGDGVVSIPSQRGDGTSLHSNGNYYIALASHFSYQPPGSYVNLVGEGEYWDTATVAIALLKGEPVDQRFERQKAPSPSMGGNVKCPVRLSFYDSSGNPVPLAGEGETEEGKPTLYYWEQGDEAFFLIVNAFGEYRIVAEGTDTGTFDLTMFRDTTGPTTYVSYASVAVMKSSRASVTVSDQSSYVMGMDTDGDGKVDKTISPTSLETVQRDGGGSEREDAWLAMAASGILVLIVVVVGVVVMRKRGVTVQGILQTAATYRPRQTMQPHDSAFCINCGKQIASDSPYCPYCGDKQGV